MKSSANDLLLAFQLLHDYTGGTFTLEKQGDLKWGETWVATFSVGYGRHKHQAEAPSPAEAIAKAADSIPNVPRELIDQILGRTPAAT